MNLFVLFFLLLFPVAPDSELLGIRAQFHEAIKEEKIAIQLEARLHVISDKTNLQQGYEGATQLLLAKYAFLPNQKYQLFSKGKLKLENAINKDRINPELIYLRYIIQMNCPSFLGYNNALREDRNYLIRAVKSIEDKDLQKRILVFLLSNSKLTSDERMLLG